MVSVIATLEQRIVDRPGDLQAEIPADARQSAAFERAIGAIRRLSRDADDLSVACAYS